ncbi:unnamed protein product [Nezara viridula]|uniref:xanthine dehydrogenase n=1 Tax=Nezara viridula TaxID=85310 RepID=A0A9P0HTD8_NEZVI|nr:unnamed protein product [Nezara viridula]
MSENTTLIFFVNGRKIEDNNIDPEWTLLYYLRKKLRLTGTKLGCAEGGCGACTVMISRYDWKNEKIVHYAVNACLLPVCALHGTAVTTVEGIGSVETKLHPVQERIAKSHGSQCGFCTPGFVMSMYTLLRFSSGRPSLKDIEIAFQGNLCRCTGYRPILDGYKTFVDDKIESNYSCPMGNDCCQNRNKIPTTNSICSESIKNGIDNNLIEKSNFLFNSEEFQPYDSSQELIFPPELAISDKLDRQSLVMKGPRVTCFRPVDLHEVITLKNKFPGAKIINGNTEVGVEVKFKNSLYPFLIIVNMVPELSAMSVEEDGVKIGAAATLTDVETFLKEQIKLRESSVCKIYESIVEILQWFAGKQIRNVAAIGGNIMTGSPISDLNQILMACGAKLELRNLDGSREVVMDEGFWTGYRKNIVKENEILCSITIPFSHKNQYFKSYKQARRREDDIAIVNAAFWLDLEGIEIKKIKMAFGGMAPTTVLACKTASKLIGKNWDDIMLEEALMSLMDELTLAPSAPGGMVLYRRSLVLSFFFKFYLHVCLELEKLGLIRPSEKSCRSAIDQFHSLIPSSSQYISKDSPSEGEHDTIGLPVVHKSAFKHATGEALYCDDLPSFENEVYLSLVTSTRTHAKIKKIDPSEALKLNGVVGFVSAKDILQERNNFGPIVHDEEIMASEKVLCHGQIIGSIAAVDQLIAQRAVNLIKVEYEDLQPVIITTQDAIKHKSFYPNSPFKVKSGDIEEGFGKSYKIIEGELTIGGQEHFYLETHCCVAIPKSEDSEMEIYTSSQHPTEIQNLVALALGIPFNRIVCKVKRMGGGFGGKESRSAYLALCTAVAAYKLKRPVRAMLDRKEDMVITGHRHPFYGKYKAGFDKDGKIKACEISLYCNAGCSTDLSDAVMERAMFHVQNTMHIENLEISGYVCRTNLPSNTAFRGFGAPQAMLLGETIVFHIAEILEIDPDLVHFRNFYKEGDYTQFKQKIVNCTIERCWNECKISSNYDERKTRVSQFNRENRFRKRGIALIPTMFGIGFSTPFLGQASALVLIYVDGSVLLSHGGTEMGQGLHTKMIQVASRALGISTDYIHISETSTDKVHNTSATAASASSDLNGMAIINACDQINERLKPLKKAKPDISWTELIKEAYFQRISLAATGFYKFADTGDPTAEASHTFYYYTYGVACSEVEIDCLTGDHQVLRTDIVMDVGQSLNPAVDVGQIEGAFVQGYGLFTLEELVYSPEGMLYSTGPGTYKIPTLSDIPAQFNVSLLKGSSNPRAVYSSKAIGEPPLFLAASVFFAIRNAVKAARKDNNIEGWFTFDSPATSARIREACVDKIIEKLNKEPASSKAWNVIV